MNCRRYWNLAAALGAALVMVAVLGRDARAETLYTERPAELRGSPADDSQVIKRVGKGKALEVVKRLGPWVMVKYEGRNGWVRRTALSTDKVGGGAIAEDDDGDSKSKKSSKKSKKGDEGEIESDGDVAVDKPAAAGARRTAARKKAERHKSRSSRHSDGEGDEEEVASKSSGADEDGGDAGMKPERPRSTWGKRSNLPGGPLKVEIQAISVQAFARPEGKGRVVFTAAEGDSVRVIGRAENRWLLVENKKKRQGWIPAVAVRDHGLLLDARKSPDQLADSGKSDEEAPGAAEDEVVEDAKPKKKTAAASDADGDDEEGAGSSRKSDDDAEASLSTSTDDELTAGSKPWSLGGSLHGGFTSVAKDITPTGANAQAASYAGPMAGLVIDGTYAFSGSNLGLVGDVSYDWSNAGGGATFSDNGTDQPDKIKLSHHRAGLTAGVSYGKTAVGILRAGFMFTATQVNDINNLAKLPRESTVGPTLGLGFNYLGFASGKLGIHAGADAMLFGSRTQTEGSKDGAELGSLTSFFGTLGVDYLIGEHLLLGGGYRFGYDKANWTGTSQRTAGTETDVKDQSHEISLGVGYRL
jgi:uncharacterized protein YgiM (DUF1202 family)